ncbi:hypothetical protein GCM10009610_05440 [Pseudonocardia xinjiangensis]
MLSSGAVDAVVNNVALVRPAMLGSVDLDHLVDVYDVNVRVAVQVTQAALPAMTAQGLGADHQRHQHGHGRQGRPDLLRRRQGRARVLLPRLGR